MYYSLPTYFLFSKIWLHAGHVIICA